MNINTPNEYPIEKALDFSTSIAFAELIVNKYIIIKITTVIKANINPSPPFITEMFDSFDKTNTGYCKTSVNAPNTKNTNNVITKYNK